MERRTKEQEMRVLRFVYDYIKSNDCAPTRKEIAKALGISYSLAHQRTQHLFGHGCLREPETRRWGRNIALTEQGILACEGDE
jgi:Mn-dependent DtxR family transcriptional regulator